MSINWDSLPEGQDVSNAWEYYRKTYNTDLPTVAEQIEALEVKDF